MLAVYPGKGTRFQRHIDNTAGDGRVLTVLVYLNTGWDEDDGGALRCYSHGDDGHVDVLPESGLLVLFDSKKLWHEVRPTQRERACLVGWFRTE